MNTGPQVLVRVEGFVGRLTLNRRAALNALTLSMCRTMIAALGEWRDDPGVSLVMIDHAGERGFCAGGDIRNLAAGDAGDGSPPEVFFHTEYRLNHRLFAYDKPVVAFMDGVVMGGGVGVALPARYRIATERTTFAMPETGIGLFPDVGGGWYLPRLPGRTGYWLALTGARIKAADCLALGIATHYIPSDRLETLKAAILAQPARIDTLLDQFAADPGAAPIAEQRRVIDRTFAGGSIETIVAALQAEATDWAAVQLDVLNAKSPLMTKVALRQLITGAQAATFADDLAMEYRIAARAVPGHDFTEGVRATILDRDNAPAWDPPTLQAVLAAMVDRFFAPLPPGEDWTPLDEDIR